MATNIYRSRIAQIKKAFGGSAKSSALLLSSAPRVRRSADTHYRYRADSDFYFLTGCTDQNCALLISSQAARPIVFATQPSNEQLLWDGAHGNAKKLANSIGAELVLTEDQRKEIMARLQGIDVLYHQSSTGTLSFRVAESILRLPSFQRGKLPQFLGRSDVLLEPLRTIKTPSDLKLLRQAANITVQALAEMCSFISNKISEAELAHSLEYFMRLHGAEPAFNSIVASGPAAAVLHYENYGRKLKNGDLLLVDCGAEHKLYASDISRTFPVSGAFSTQQAELYSIVLEAQNAAIKKVRPNAIMKDVYDAAAKVITTGLVEMGVLRGKVSALMNKEAYKNFFPHGIGHNIGLDVHDLGALRGRKDIRLHEGMVITIEPGIYFPKRTGKIPPCGIRIEDTVHVSRHGAEVLTGAFPKDLGSIEEMIG